MFFVIASAQFQRHWFVALHLPIPDECRVSQSSKANGEFSRHRVSATPRSHSVSGLDCVPGKARRLRHLDLVTMPQWTVASCKIVRLDRLICCAYRMASCPLDGLSGSTGRGVGPAGRFICNLDHVIVSFHIRGLVDCVRLLLKVSPRDVLDCRRRRAIRAMSDVLRGCERHIDRASRTQFPTLPTGRTFQYRGFDTVFLEQAAEKVGRFRSD